MSEMEWIEYPENRPVKSGLHVVNREVNSKVTNTIGYYDTGAQIWYEDPVEKVPLSGVNAYYNKRILPYVRKTN